MYVSKRKERYRELVEINQYRRVGRGKDIQSSHISILKEQIASQGQTHRSRIVVMVEFDRSSIPNKVALVAAPVELSGRMVALIPINSISTIVSEVTAEDGSRNIIEIDSTISVASYFTVSEGNTKDRDKI